ncbi:MAG: ATP-binding protein [bacterium]|nr:ATP-binding protein [bacterium]
MAQEQHTREFERKQAQLLQAERMAAMAKLAAGVAHEINNPAGVLMMKLKFLLSIAEAEGLSERAVSTLNVAVEQTARIEGIVENLLGFCRPTDVTPRRCDVNQICAAALAPMQQRLQPSGPPLIWQPGSDPLLVEADANELERALIHLVNNAICAAGPEGRVTVTTGTSDADITLAVADNGPGIPDDFRERIFDPFFTTRPVGEGTGLGLAITYGIVQKFGGCIDVATVRQQGTTMTVRLPAVGPAR